MIEDGGLGIRGLGFRDQGLLRIGVVFGVEGSGRPCNIHCAEAYVIGLKPS